VKPTPALLALVLCAQQSVAAPGLALTLDFASPADPTATRSDPQSSYRLPTGPFDGTAVPARLTEGAVQAQAWRIAGEGQSTLALMSGLKAQLGAQGWRVVYECEAQACGGFDFRFATEVLPEPDMHVDLGDFRYLAAEKGDEVASLIVSRSASAGFVQLTRVSSAPATGTAPPVILADKGDPVPDDRTATLSVPSGQSTTFSTAGAPPFPPPDAAAGPLLSRLEQTGSAALDDLRFASGSADLEDGEYASLSMLAGWLRADATRRVALVGHTDASGALEANIALSRRRAEQVRAVLTGPLEVPRAQVVAEGVGYLSPRASNLTEAGRQANRRVEVVVTTAP
jgi:outer membrane protein OmpA-like peptidoglycan-associated protein